MRCGEMDGEPGDAIGAALDFAGVYPASYLEPKLAGVADHLLRTAHSLSRAGEEGQHAVPGGVDGLTAVRRDGRPGLIEVALDRFRPCSVTRLSGAARRVDEIGEQDGRQDAIRGRRGRPAGDELLDYVGEQADIEGEDKARIAWDLTEGCAGNKAR